MFSFKTFLVIATFVAISVQAGRLPPLFYKDYSFRSENTPPSEDYDVPNDWIMKRMMECGGGNSQPECNLLHLNNDLDTLNRLADLYEDYTMNKQQKIRQLIDAQGGAKTIDKWAMDKTERGFWEFMTSLISDK